MTGHIKEALILAGGLGTRLRSVVSDMPKPMAHVAGRPFLAYLIEYWIRQGITHFTLSVGYKKESIIEYFGNEYKGAVIRYVHEDTPLGTGGGLRLALTQEQWTGNYILLLNGDTWFEADLAQLSDDAEHTRAPIIMSLKTMENNNRYGGVVVDAAGKVINFESNHSGEMLINAGCYALNHAELKNLLAVFPEKFSFESEVLTPFAAKGLIFSSIQEKKFLDIGIPDDYTRAEFFIEGTI